jgi:hypothetical protein
VSGDIGCYASCSTLPSTVALPCFILGQPVVVAGQCRVLLPSIPPTYSCESHLPLRRHKSCCDRTLLVHMRTASTLASTNARAYIHSRADTVTDQVFKHAFNSRGRWTHARFSTLSCRDIRNTDPYAREPECKFPASPRTTTGHSCCRIVSQCPLALPRRQLIMAVRFSARKCGANDS